MRGCSKSIITLVQRLAKSRDGSRRSRPEQFKSTYRVQRHVGGLILQRLRKRDDGLSQERPEILLKCQVIHSVGGEGTDVPVAISPKGRGKERNRLLRPGDMTQRIDSLPAYLAIGMIEHLDPVGRGVPVPEISVVGHSLPQPPSVRINSSSPFTPRN